MLALDVLYVAFATIAVMIILQISTYVVTRLLYPPEPKIIYRDIPVVQQPLPIVQQPVPVFQQTPPPTQTENGITLIQDKQEVQLPEYEPRKPASTSLRMDTELPLGLQETRPNGL